MLPNKHVEMQLALSSKLVFNTCIKDESTKTTLNFKADPLSRKHQPLLSLQPLLSVHHKNLHGFSLHLVHLMQRNPLFGEEILQNLSITLQRSKIHKELEWLHGIIHRLGWWNLGGWNFGQREKPGFSTCLYCDNLMAYQFKMVTAFDWISCWRTNNPSSFYSYTQRS